MIMMTQMTMVQGMSDVVHGLLFALVCGCRQVTGQMGGSRSQGDHIDCCPTDTGSHATTLSSGQMLLPGIAEPYRWEFGGKRQGRAGRET
jgi:hypothetical protein